MQQILVNTTLEIIESSQTEVANGEASAKAVKSCCRGSKPTKFKKKTSITMNDLTGGENTFFCRINITWWKRGHSAIGFY